MRTPGPQRPRRRGLASLELALALPFLLFMAAVIFKVAEANLTKADACVRVRRDSWRPADAALEREGKPFPDETLMQAALQLDDKPGHGAADGRTAHTLRMGPVTHGSVELEARLTVLQGTWDHQSIDFPERPPLQPDKRAWTMLAVGALPEGATQADVNALDFDPEALSSKFDPSQFNFTALVTDGGDMKKTAQALIEAANPGLQQADMIAKAAKNPAKAAKDLIGTVTDLDQFGKAIEKIADAPDAFDKLGDMLGDVADGVEALKDLNVSGPGLQAMEEVAKTMKQVADAVRPVKEGLDAIKKAIDTLKKLKPPKIPIP